MDSLTDATVMIGILTGLCGLISLLYRLGAPRQMMAGLLTILVLLYPVILINQNFGWLVKSIASLFFIHISLVTLRVMASRYPAGYIHHQTVHSLKQTVVLLGGWMLLLFAFSAWPILTDSLLPAYVILSLALASGLCFNILASVFKFKASRASNLSAKDLPTVTLAIPARNEDAALEAGLHAHLASDYPKLEIIVLDDCSQDSTSEIIKSFAHRGVRFISGSQITDDWAGKTFAYQQLLEQASGDYILFAGVDIDLTKNSIRQIVDKLTGHNLKMLTILPEYKSIKEIGTLPEVGRQLIRYFWQIGLKNLFSMTDPVIGSCWLVDRRALLEVGGFKSVKRMIEPEKHFAKVFSREKAYKFFLSKHFKDPIISQKPGKEQIRHITRVAYPSLHRSLLSAISASLLVVSLGILPVAGLIYSFFIDEFSLAFISLAISSGLIYTAYTALAFLASPKYIWAVPILIPIHLIETSALIIWSMLKYEFSTVEWKGRNLCIAPLNLQFQPTPKKGRNRRRR